MHIHSLESSTKYTARKKNFWIGWGTTKQSQPSFFVALAKWTRRVLERQREVIAIAIGRWHFFLSIIFKLDWNNEILDTIEEQMYLWKNLCFVHCNHIIFKWSEKKIQLTRTITLTRWLSEKPINAHHPSYFSNRILLVHSII